VWVKGIKDKLILTKEIIEICSSYEKLVIAEQKLIDKYWDDEYCMNLNHSSLGAGVGEKNVKYGKTHSEETKKKISEAISKSHKNRIISDDTRQKMSIAKKGKSQTKEHIQKVSIANTGSKNPSAILNELIVLQIRKDILPSYTNNQLSTRYDVSYNTIVDIRKYRTWKNVKL
jgi:hypothetical protein